MRIENIECFLALAETLNYTEAANRLYITQSALSRTILQMEEELGVVLFTRTRRNVSLTPAGLSFLEDGGRIIESYNAGVSRAKTAYLGERGRIVFACHTNNVEPVTMDILSGFRRRHPDITVDAAGMTTSRMLYALDEGSIDATVTSGVPRLLSAERIFLKQYRECVVVPPSHPLAGRGEISMEDLRSERFAVMSRDFSSRGYDSVIGKARAAGFTPSINAQAVSVPHLLSMLVSGGYVTILSENYRYMTWDRLVFVPLTQRAMTDVYFMWDTKNENPCVKLLADYVRQEFRRERPAD